MSNVLRSMMGRAGMSFGHLAKITPRGARAEGDDDDREDRDDDSGKGKKGKRAAGGDDDDDDDDDDGQNRENGDSKKGKRAEGDDDDREDRDDDSGKGKKGKRAAGGDDDDEDEDEDEDGDRAENDDDDEEEMRGKSASARARRRERARCAAIFGCKAAAKNPVLAANLAFNTSMTRNQAIRVLNETPAPQATYGSRRNPNLGAGGEQSQSREQAVASSWDRAFSKARGER
ncbi:hypothetical protein KDW37_31110 [Burkholderia cenocepacia]|uniref:hypothetical protein n=1 Tax=Burkholderia cenocepacia TaxID=95486 RepID=UPI001B8ED317|nr:hypothetical protein [Burkholderia cenocepacia]MBR8435209.1 hypothetical protein [Burkholderia cenocepacia]